jgi:hypothetical protein
MQNQLEENTLNNPIAPIATTGAVKIPDSATGFMKRLTSPEVTTGVATGVIVSTGSSLGKNLLHKLLMQPLVLFGLGVGVGVGAGYLVYKYRQDQEIVTTTGDAQKES